MAEQEVPKTIEELDQLIEKKQSQQTKSVWPYIIVSLILPPFTLIIALYLAWKKKVLHLALPLIVVIYSILTGMYLGSIFSYRYVASSLAPLYNLTEELTPATKPQTILFDDFLIKFLMVLLLFLVLAGLIGGLYFRSKAKKKNGLSNEILTLLFGIMILQFISIYLLFSSISKEIMGAI